MKRLILVFFVTFLIQLSSSFTINDNETISQTTIAAKENDTSWQKYLSSNEIKFDSSMEELKCYETYTRHMARIESHNSNLAAKWKMGKNHFTHMPYSDFKETRLGTQLPVTKIKILEAEMVLQKDFQEEILQAPPGLFGSYDSSNLPESLSYLDLMQPVQDQGDCGCCWAFATVAQIEAVKKALNPSFNSTLSASYLVDCDYFNLGCFGGWPANAMWWLKLAGDFTVSTSTYPYEPPIKPKIKNTCAKLQGNFSPIGISNIVDDGPSTEADLMLQLANQGPQVAAIYVSSNFQLYQNGVFTDNTCFTGDCSSINHAVLVIGYGNDPVGGDFWTIRNSWGTSWGENGYMRIARNQGSMCQIGCWPQYATFSNNLLKIKT